MHAKYTVHLKTLMDNEETRAKLEAALSTYPLYESKSKQEFIPAYIPKRPELNKKILNAYKYREIGFETVGRFLDELEISMNEIMPRYNLLFFTADQDFNIIFNVDYQRTIDTGRTGTTSSTTSGTDKQTDEENSTSTTQSAGTTTTTGQDSSTGTSTTTAEDSSSTTSNVNAFSKNVHSATPQSELDIPAENIDGVSYADDATWNKSKNNDTATTTGSNSGETETTHSGSSSGETETEQTGSTTGTLSKTANTESTASTDGTMEQTEQTLETTKGNFGVVSAQDLILKYRETILNIEQMIINDERISELFMRVY